MALWATSRQPPSALDLNVLFGPAVVAGGEAFVVELAADVDEAVSGGTDGQPADDLTVGTSEVDLLGAWVVERSGTSTGRMFIRDDDEDLRRSPDEQLLLLPSGRRHGRQG